MGMAAATTPQSTEHKAKHKATATTHYMAREILVIFLYLNQRGSFILQ